MLQTSSRCRRLHHATHSSARRAHARRTLCAPAAPGKHSSMPVPRPNGQSQQSTVQKPPPQPHRPPATSKKSSKFEPPRPRFEPPPSMYDQKRLPPTSFLDYLKRFRAEAWVMFMGPVTAGLIITVYQLQTSRETERAHWRQRLQRLKDDGERLRLLQVQERESVINLVRDSESPELEQQFFTRFEATDKILRYFNAMSSEERDAYEAEQENMKNEERYTAAAAPEEKTSSEARR